MRFSDIPGHQKEKEIFLQLSKGGRLGHAYALAGAEGNGALQLALAWATFVNCESPGEQEACGNCSNCRLNARLEHPDVHLFFPAFTDSKAKIQSSQDLLPEFRQMLLEKKYFGISDMAQEFGVENKELSLKSADTDLLIQKTSLKTFQSKYRVIVIWLMEKMVHGMSNKLLKTIEEPPPNTLILIVSQKPESMLKTVQSRVQFIRIGPFLDEEIEKYVETFWELDGHLAKSLAYLADGNMAKAIRDIGDNDQSVYENVVEFFSLLRAGDELGLMDFAEAKRSEKGEKIQYWFEIAQNYVREMLALQKLMEYPPRIPKSVEENLRRLAGAWTVEHLTILNQELGTAAYRSQRNLNPRVLFSALGLKLVSELERLNQLIA